MTIKIVKISVLIMEFALEEIVFVTKDTLGMIAVFHAPNIMMEHHVSILAQVVLMQILIMYYFFIINKPILYISYTKIK